MYPREIAKILFKSASSFPAVFLTGPRQSGKTTLLRELFPKHRYISLETPSTLELMEEDPQGFLSDEKTSWIIDEAQNFPKLFSYLQGMIDENPRPGRFLLSGSQNFLLHHKISQTLSGRTAILELLPLSYKELVPHITHNEDDLWQLIYKGGYPRPRFEDIEYSLWFESYIRTYVERDIRSLVNVKDLAQFQKFIKLCAARHGQMLNLSSLGADCGISQPTARDWLTFLEASYLVFRVHPYFENFTKRLVKTAKIYFYDSGILCQLLGITSPEQAQMHAMRGPLFEGFIMSDMIKRGFNLGHRPSLYYWRDHHGLEIDAVLENGQSVQLIELKSSQTFQKEYLTGLRKILTLANSDRFKAMLVYGGKESSLMQEISVVGWREYLTK